MIIQHRKAILAPVLILAGLLGVMAVISLAPQGAGEQPQEAEILNNPTNFWADNVWTNMLDDVRHPKYYYLAYFDDDITPIFSAAYDLGEDNCITNAVVQTIFTPSITVTNGVYTITFQP